MSDPTPLFKTFADLRAELGVTTRQLRRLVAQGTYHVAGCWFPADGRPAWLYAAGSGVERVVAFDDITDDQEAAA